MTPTRSPALSRAAWLVAWLACTGATMAILMSPKSAPLDVDEVYWIGSSYYYHLAFEQRDWNHPAWQLLPARENPPISKYVIGLGVAVSGYHLTSIDLLGSYYAYYAANLGQHPLLKAQSAKQDSVTSRMSPGLLQRIGSTRQMYIAPELLLAARRVTMVCGAITSLLVFLLGSSIASRAAGLLASQLLLLHPAVVAASELAMADAIAFMFGTAGALATWHFFRVSHASRPHLLAALSAGILIGLACGAKMNWLIVAFLFGAVAVYLTAQAWRRDDRTGARLALACGVGGLATAFAVFVAFNPTILADPARGLVAVVQEPRTTTALQSQLYDSYCADRPECRVPGVPFLLSGAGARLEAVGRMVLGNFWVFALAVAGVAVACIRAPRRGVWFVGAWWAISLLCVSVWIPFEWTRYVLPVVVPFVLLSAHLVVVTFGAVLHRIPRAA